MLILTRRIGETLVIGDDVQVTVLGVKGNQVRLGIKAPEGVRVDREEIYNRIQQEKAIASAILSCIGSGLNTADAEKSMPI